MEPSLGGIIPRSLHPTKFQPWAAVVWPFPAIGTRLHSHLKWGIMPAIHAPAIRCRPGSDNSKGSWLAYRKLAGSVRRICQVYDTISDSRFA